MWTDTTQAHEEITHISIPTEKTTAHTTVTTDSTAITTIITDKKKEAERLLFFDRIEQMFRS